MYHVIIISSIFVPSFGDIAQVTCQSESGTFPTVCTVLHCHGFLTMILFPKKIIKKNKNDRLLGNI